MLEVLLVVFVVMVVMVDSLRHLRAYRRRNVDSRDLLCYGRGFCSNRLGDAGKIEHFHRQIGIFSGGRSGTTKI